MNERDVVITTQAGRMPAFAVCPDGEGPWPAILFYMDARGMREELRNMARRIAKHGYFVIMPDLYYRFGRLDFDLTARNEAMILMIRAARKSLTKQPIIDDTAAMIAYLDGQDKVREGPVGAVGYCMGGPFITWAAEAFNMRIRAAASLYGVEMVTDGEESPHLCLPRIDGALYYGFAEKDHFSPPEMIEAFRQALDAAKCNYELDIYKDADHGFAFAERPVYVPEAAETHWGKLFALWDTHLK